MQEATLVGSDGGTFSCPNRMYSEKYYWIMSAYSTSTNHAMAIIANGGANEAYTQNR